MSSTLRSTFRVAAAPGDRALDVQCDMQDGWQATSASPAKAGNRCDRLMRRENEFRYMPGNRPANADESP
ncbi:hypothetical protein [Burkholderia lata]|uniref:hypothetical protein n=1 Tax=Burkholderia lata (strain ATCC 17760 / DSM 23089 / LMG 22485 / NCIMB 9086 / R18194 / 383) TaxID=482957 RepID=UPI00242E1066|nr:hypothetical protein [Burkholderia lata]